MLDPLSGDHSLLHDLNGVFGQFYRPAVWQVEFALQGEGETTSWAYPFLPPILFALYRVHYRERTATLSWVLDGVRNHCSLCYDSWWTSRLVLRG